MEVGCKLCLTLIAILLVTLLNSPNSTAEASLSIESHYGDNYVYLHDRYNLLKIVVRFEAPIDEGKLAVSESQITFGREVDVPSGVRGVDYGLGFKDLEVGNYSIGVFLNYSLGDTVHNESARLSFFVRADFDILSFVGPSTVSTQGSAAEVQVIVHTMMRNTVIAFCGSGVEFHPTTSEYEELHPGNLSVSSLVKADPEYSFDTGFYCFSISGFAGGHELSFTDTGIDITFDDDVGDGWMPSVVGLSVALSVTISILVVVILALRSIRRRMRGPAQ